MFSQGHAPGCSMGAGAPSDRNESRCHMKTSGVSKILVQVMPVLRVIGCKCCGRSIKYNIVIKLGLRLGRLYAKRRELPCRSLILCGRDTSTWSEINGVLFSINVFLQ